ncbi:unnamed protein product, partial [marine sediment metagenome]
LVAMRFAPVKNIVGSLDAPCNSKSPGPAVRPSPSQTPDGKRERDNLP